MFSVIDCLNISSVEDATKTDGDGSSQGNDNGFLVACIALARGCSACLAQ